MLLAGILLPDIALAQTGLAISPAAGLVGLVIAVLALIGFSILVVSSVHLIRQGASLKTLLFLFLGLVLQSPAIWFVSTFLPAWIPRTRSWDFSLSRDVSQLDPRLRIVDQYDRDRGRYTYVGNIRSSIKLPSNSQWSGSARSVTFDARLDQITGIRWYGKTANTDRAHQEAKRILEELGFTNHDLDSWHAKARGGDLTGFYFDTEADPRITVLTQAERYPDAPERTPENTFWSVRVEVWWNAQNR